MTDANDELPWNLIYSYSRKQAIEDGVLVDATNIAKEAGFRFPVALTAELWHGWIEPDNQGRREGQSETGRLWDVLTMLRHAIRGSQGSQVDFDVLFQKEGKLEKVRLKSLCGPGDEAEPVITIMMPHED
jgi:hypothetical protein